MIFKVINGAVEEKALQVIKFSFQTVCLFSAIVLTSWCYYKYSLDKDVSSLNYKMFNHEPGSLYPSISLCIVNPYLEDSLKRHGSDVNSSSYVKYLMGGYWSKNMTSVDYEKVTINMKNYLKNLFIQFTDDTQMQLSMDDNENEMIEMFYVGYTSPMDKCFTFDMPYKPNVQISAFRLTVMKKIFPRGIRPARVRRSLDHGDPSQGFGISFHHPGEYLRFFSTEQYSWTARKENNESNFAMVYRLSSMEVWKRRNKPSKPCVEELGDDDKLVMQNVVDEIGCKPPYLSSTRSSNICTSISDLRSAYGMLVRVLQLDPTNYPPPCQIIHNLIIDFEEYDLPGDAKSDPFFIVEISQGVAYYKEIEQVRAYDEETLIGNSGGYIGLFLGCSLSQVSRNDQEYITLSEYVLGI